MLRPKSVTRCGAPGNNHVHLRRQMLDQKGDCFVNDGCFNDVVIVKDQDGGLRRRTDLIDQCGQQWLDPGRWRHMLCDRRIAVDVWISRLHGGRHVREETHGIVIAGIEREPGCR
jgi:hypothetical protein